MSWPLTGTSGRRRCTRRPGAAEAEPVEPKPRERLEVHGCKPGLLPAADFMVVVVERWRGASGGRVWRELKFVTVSYDPGELFVVVLLSKDMMQP